MKNFLSFWSIGPCKHNRIARHSLSNWPFPSFLIQFISLFQFIPSFGPLALSLVILLTSTVSCYSDLIYAGIQWVCLKTGHLKKINYSTIRLKSKRCGALLLKCEMWHGGTQHIKVSECILLIGKCYIILEW